MKPELTLGAAMPHSRRIEMGSRLRECRLAANLSLAEVAEHLSVSKQAVSYWETGRTNLDAMRLGDLALMYGVSSDYVLFGTHMIPEILRDALSRAKASDRPSV